MSKSRDAFRTISEVSEALDTPAHVLRFWESKFSQVKPVKRAGGRRYYRPADLNLLAGIKKLLHDDGMTIKGAQKLLRDQGVRKIAEMGQNMLEDQTAQDGAIDGTSTPAPSGPGPTDTEVTEQTRVDTPPAASKDEGETPSEPVAARAPQEVARDTSDAAEGDDDTLGITNVVTLPTAEPRGPSLSMNLSPDPDANAAAPPEEAAAPESEATVATEQDNADASDRSGDDPAAEETIAPTHTAVNEGSDAADSPASEPDSETEGAAVPVEAQASGPEDDDTTAATLSVPDDPSDTDSKAPARVFHLLQKTPPEALARHAAEIAPLLDRMQNLRSRISTR